MEKKTFHFKADGKANSEQRHTPTSLGDGTSPDDKKEYKHVGERRRGEEKQRRTL